MYCMEVMEFCCFFFFSTQEIYHPVLFDFVWKNSEQIPHWWEREKRGALGICPLTEVPLFPQLWHLFPWEEGLEVRLSWKFQNVGHPLNGWCPKWVIELNVVVCGRHQYAPHILSTSQAAFLLPFIFRFRNQSAYHLIKHFRPLFFLSLFLSWAGHVRQARSLLFTCWSI